MAETNSTPHAANPWTLAVTFGAPQDYEEAAPSTRLWLGRPWRTIGADFRPEVFQIILAGERQDLIGQLNQYALWPSAQLDFRASEDVPHEHGLTDIQKEG